MEEKKTHEKNIYKLQERFERIFREDTEGKEKKRKRKVKRFEK